MQRIAKILTALTTVAAFIGVSATSANALPQNSIDFHNARYCEILELKGTLPDARVVVWNTIGLNKCPAAKWDTMDAGEIASANGDTLVVLNGPRHFLMDSAVGKTGVIKTFNGLQLRRVATLPVTTPADLVQTPYVGRTVNRTNTWSWKSGRRVYELFAPDGNRYVMQSYSNIIDPNQKIGDLASLGARLNLPTGWRYRVRKLDHPLDIVTKGEATIVQDDLKNTYQLVAKSKTAPKPERHRVDMTGETKEVGSPTPGVIEDTGTVAGKPFGAGTIDLLVTFGPNSTVTGTFQIDAEHGSVFGTVAMDYTIQGSEITFNGTAQLTGGTKRYRGIEGEDLKAYDHNTLDGQNGTVELKGFATY